MTKNFLFYFILFVPPVALWFLRGGDREHEIFLNDVVNINHSFSLFYFVRIVSPQLHSGSLEEGSGGMGGVRRGLVFGLLSPVFVQAFTLNVLAEWGDRSQIATVIMSAREVGIFNK